MSLRGKKPTAIEKRLKVLFYGSAGAGKTMTSIHFPTPYLIDTEKGAENKQYVDVLEKNGGAIFQTSDFDEMMTEIRSLLIEKHEYKTLIIDPLTTVYNDLLDKAERKVGNEFGRHYGEANKQMKAMLNMLLRLDMNVIITAHSKKEYGDNLKIIGETFDCYKKLDYLFDLVFRIQKRGKERIAMVEKTRIEAFSEAEQFPFSYDAIAEKYGREILERDSVPIKLASVEQVTECNRLIELLSIDQETIEKWFKKANCNNLNDMSDEVILKCIDFLKNKIKGEE